MPFVGSPNTWCEQAISAKRQATLDENQASLKVFAAFWFEIP
jgi:hypothetical protein